MIALAALLLATPTHAPAAREGSVALLGGLRLVPQGGFSTSAGVVDRALAPGAFAGEFGYQWDETLAVAVDLSYGLDRYDFADQSRLRVGAFAVTFLGFGTLHPYRWLELFGGGGAAYNFTTFNGSGPGGPTYKEGTTEGAVLALGLKLALAGRFGVQLEDRYTFAFADSGRGSMNVGGNFLGLGVWLALEPEKEDPLGHD